MSEIYFGIPKSTHEAEVGIPDAEGGLTVFHVIFFESEYSSLRIITVCGGRKEDGKINIKSMENPVQCLEPIRFEFTAAGGMPVIFNIYVEDEYRNISVTY